MFGRLLWESFARQRRRKALAAIAILLGTTAVTAMLALATTIGDRIHRELAVYGANIVVYPKADTLDVKVGGVDLKPATGGAYLKESDLEKLKGIFWANNITGISPELDLGGRGLFYRTETGPRTPVTALAVLFDNPLVQGPTEEFHHGGRDGALALHPWWKVKGQLPEDYIKKFGAYQVLVGSRLANQLNLSIGDQFGYEAPSNLNLDTPRGIIFQVTGILSSGDEAENELILPLRGFFFEASRGRYDTKLSRVEISARTRPEDAFARMDPEKLSPKQHDLWYCRPYANSIAYQIMEAIPGSQAEQVRRVEQSEGTVLSRISGLMWLVSAAALLAAGFAVSAAMATAVLERRGEIGLMRSLGASKGAIAGLFYAESGLLAVGAGLVGYVAGSGLAFWLGSRIFPGDGAGALLNWALLPVVVGLALVVAVAGSTPSIRGALRTEPSSVLRGDA